jgi:hypothetical protein
MTRREWLAVSPGLLLLNCSGNTTKRAAEKPPEPVTGLYALYQLYRYASTWAPDLNVFGLSSLHIADVKAMPGKAAAWRAQFSSASLARERTYTFSLYDEGTTLRKGMFADAPGPFPASNRSFAIREATVDSDKAWEIALGHSQKYSAAHPDIPVSWTLESDRQTGAPVWRIIWGVSASRSDFSILVDAHSGTYLQTIS